MQKPADLRAWLTTCLPEFARHPDQLQVWVEDGQILTRRSTTLSFVYVFQLSLLVTDWTGSPDRLILPLLAWIERHQPDQLQRADNQPFTFEAEILDSDRVDLLFKIDLTEPVVATPNADGTGFDLSRAPAPPVDSYFDDGSAPRFWQGYAALELAAQTKDPAAELIAGVPPMAAP